MTCNTCGGCGKIRKTETSAQAGGLGLRRIIITELPCPSCHPVTPSEKRCACPGICKHRLPNHGFVELPIPSSDNEITLTKEEAEAGYYDTPSAPTPGEDWEREWREQVELLVKALPNRESYTLSSAFGVLAVPFIRDLLSSHASKAREEGRKEGAVEQWEKDREAVGNCLMNWQLAPPGDTIIAIRQALSQTNPKKE